MIRVAERLLSTPGPNYKEGRMLNALTQYLIDKVIKENPEKFIKHLIRKYLVGYHLASNPIRKSKRSNGAAII